MKHILKKESQLCAGRLNLTPYIHHALCYVFLHVFGVCASIQYKSIWINYDKSSGIMAVLTSTHHY